MLASAEDLTPVLHLLTERARALLARDADRLVSCAEQLLDLGLVGRAAHAFTAASDLLQEVTAETALAEEQKAIAGQEQGKADEAATAAA